MTDHTTPDYGSSAADAGRQYVYSEGPAVPPAQPETAETVSPAPMPPPIGSVPERAALHGILRVRLEDALQTMQAIRLQAMEQGQADQLMVLTAAHRTLMAVETLLPAILTAPDERTPEHRHYLRSIIRLEAMHAERDRMVAATESLYAVEMAHAAKVQARLIETAIGVCTVCGCHLFPSDTGFFADGLYFCADHAPEYGDMGAAILAELDEDEYYCPDWASDREEAQAQARAWMKRGPARMLTLL